MRHAGIWTPDKATLDTETLGEHGNQGRVEILSAVLNVSVVNIKCMKMKSNFNIYSAHCETVPGSIPGVA